MLFAGKFWVSSHWNEVKSVSLCGFSNFQNIPVETLFSDPKSSWQKYLSKHGGVLSDVSVKNNSAKVSGSGTAGKTTETESSSSWTFLV